VKILPWIVGLYLMLLVCQVLFTAIILDRRLETWADKVFWLVCVCSTLFLSGILFTYTPLKHVLLRGVYTFLPYLVASLLMGYDELSNAKWWKNFRQGTTQ
jgi:hypothetical protein